MTDGCSNKFRLPPPLSVIEGNVSEHYKKWKRQVEMYPKAIGAAKKDKEVQTIFNCAGPQTIDIYDQFLWHEEGVKRNPRNCLKNLNARLLQSKKERSVRIP